MNGSKLQFLGLAKLGVVYTACVQFFPRALAPSISSMCVLGSSSKRAIQKCPKRRATRIWEVCCTGTQLESNESRIVNDR